MTLDPTLYISQIGQMADQDIDLSSAALALSAPQHEGVSLQRYTHHFEKLSEEVAARHLALLEAGAEDDAGTQLAALKHVISDQYDYQADERGAQNLQNADIMGVVDRARGLPIMVGLIYLHCGLAQGWSLEGLSMPGPFVCRIERGGQRIIFSPGARAQVMEAQDLRAQVKEALGGEAELSNAYYDGLPRRAVLVAVLNIFKNHMIDVEDYEGALDIVEQTLKIAPQEYRFLLDAGVLYARVNKHLSAIRSLEGFIEQTPHAQERYEAGLILDQIKEEMIED